MGNREKVRFRVLFITEENPFYVRVFFEEFFKSYEDLDGIVGVLIAPAMGKRTPWELVKQAHGFYGTLDFLRMVLKYGGLTMADYLPRWAGRTESFRLDRLCRSHGMRVVRETNLHADVFLEQLRTMELDLIVSVAAPVIFRRSLIDIPRLGCINIHSSRLPQYRGMMPNFWQMYHNEERCGMTIHEINEKIDEGRILLQRETDIGPGETLDRLIKRTKRMGAHLMIEALDLLKSGEVRYKENVPEKGSYFSFPSREDVKEFRRRGKRVM